MNVRPLHTVPLRLGLHITKRRNAMSRERLEKLERKFAPWAELGDKPIAAASLSSTIHPYPGLGHQLSSWISGELWARDLGLSYSGGTVTRDENGLFNFPTQRPLPGGRGSKHVRLRSVNDERDPRSLAILRGQVNRALDDARGRPVHFQLSLDQARWDQTPSSASVRSAVLDGAQGDRLRRIEDDEDPYIAIHVRRGDVDKSAMGGLTGQSRWIDEDWYISIIRQLRQNTKLAAMQIRVYALGEPEDFPLLRRESVSLCLNGDRDLDFVELCAANILVVAPSSFSFAAGLASRGVVVARYPWWHHIPEGGSWVRADAGGLISSASLARALTHGL